MGEEIPFDEVPQRLVGMGYTNAGAADAPGLFRVHGDTVEVFPHRKRHPCASSSSATRLTASAAW
ncbi:MAG: hypothetical protein ACLU0O_08915 [Collinsella sp.]